MFKNTRNSSSLLGSQHGQAMLEYAVVTAMIAAALIYPYDGEMMYVWVIDVLEDMNLNFVNGLSLYAYPL